jgi:hypothetical protein
MAIFRTLGVDEGERLKFEFLRPKNDIIRAALPPGIAANSSIHRCHYLVIDYLLRYVAAGARDHMGECLLASYPVSGIPCGYDSRENLVYLYSPEF